MEGMPLVFQIALGVTLGMALWAATRVAWTQRGMVVADLKSLGDVLLRISVFAALTILISLVPAPLTVWWGWVLLLIGGLMALAWGAWASRALFTWKQGSLRNQLAGVVLLGVAAFPAIRVALCLPELLVMVSRLAGLNLD